MKVHLWTYYKKIDLLDKNALVNFDGEKKSDITFEPIGNYPDYYYHFAPQLSIHTGSNNMRFSNTACSMQRSTICRKINTFVIHSISITLPVL